MYLNMLGKHEDRIKNLYFIYAVVMRAINRAEPILKAYDYSTRLDQAEDEKTGFLIEKLLNNTLRECE